MSTLSSFTVPGIIFLITVAFGVGLHLSGKPYSGILFYIHKLTALGMVIATVVQLSRTLKSSNQHALLFILLALAAVFFIALFASGALMSIGKLNQNALLSIHKISLGGMAITIALAVYQLT